MTEHDPSQGEQLKDALPTETRISPGVERLLDLNRQALADPNAFWAPIAEELHWAEKGGPIFTRLTEPPYGTWFKGWKTNLCYNCVDRWMTTEKRNKVAFYWEGEPGDRRTISYYELYREVNRLASVMKELGVGEGDRVAIYLPMIPEAIFAMLATARLGAIHSVVFGGFTAQALADRMNDSKQRLLITADGGFRAGKIVELKKIADQAMLQAPSIEKAIVVKRTGQPVEMKPGRDVWYHDVVPNAAPYVAPEWIEGTHPSYILYTSGTTGKPKGAVHSTAGYMLWLYYTTKAVFDVTDRDVFWCTADVGWVTGHSYIVYGPLLRGLTSFFYEGAPQIPTWDRWWSLIERYGITTLYTSPTAIRSFIKQGEKLLEKHDLSSLRMLGSVGEPINGEAWHWYNKHIGHGRCQIVDTWWQTETGGILITPQPGTATIPLKPGSATLPLPGVDAAVVNEEGHEVKPGEKGFIVIRSPWPGQFMTLWNDDARYKSVYFTRFPGFYYPSDYCIRDSDGYFWLLGRADEVMKVAGHRISTTEIENILIMHPAVAESAVIGKKDEVKGEVPIACVILKPGHSASPELRQQLLDHVRNNLGPIGVPAQIYFVDRVPKTRSAKIMRRLIRDVVEERPLGDVTTLEDETSVEEARKAYQDFKATLDKGKV
jgi:acetyl-CoA synthetase